MSTNDLQADVLVRAWEPNLMQEGARFQATTVRRDVTFQARIGDAMSLDVETITQPGLIVIAPSAGPGGQNAVDVCVRAMPDQIKFTILRTDELVWIPIAAHRDPMMNWHIECVPFVEWLRIVLRFDPSVKASQDGR